MQTITHTVRNRDHAWVDLQRDLRRMLAESGVSRRDVRESRIVGISRDDGQSDYSAPGSFTVRFRALGRTETIAVEMLPR